MTLPHVRSLTYIFFLFLANWSLPSHALSGPFSFNKMPTGPYIGFYEQMSDNSEYSLNPEKFINMANFSDFAVVNGNPDELTKRLSEAKTAKLNLLVNLGPVVLNWPAFADLTQDLGKAVLTDATLASNLSKMKTIIATSPDVVSGFYLEEIFWTALLHSKDCGAAATNLKYMSQQLSRVANSIKGTFPNFLLAVAEEAHAFDAVISDGSNCPSATTTFGFPSSVDWIGSEGFYPENLEEFDGPTGFIHYLGRFAQYIPAGKKTFMVINSLVRSVQTANQQNNEKLQKLWEKLKQSVDSAGLTPSAYFFYYWHEAPFLGYDWIKNAFGTEKGLGQAQRSSQMLTSLDIFDTAKHMRIRANPGQPVDILHGSFGNQTWETMQINNPQPSKSLGLAKIQADGSLHITPPYSDPGDTRAFSRAMFTLSRPAGISNTARSYFTGTLSSENISCGDGMDVRISCEDYLGKWTEWVSTGINQGEAPKTFFVDLNLLNKTNPRCEFDVYPRGTSWCDHLVIRNLRVVAPNAMPLAPPADSKLLDFSKWIYGNQSWAPMVYGGSSATPTLGYAREVSPGVLEMDTPTAANSFSRALFPLKFSGLKSDATTQYVFKATLLPVSSSSCGDGVTVNVDCQFYSGTNQPYWISLISSFSMIHYGLAKDIYIDVTPMRYLASPTCELQVHSKSDGNCDRVYIDHPMLYSY